MKPLSRLYEEVARLVEQSVKALLRYPLCDRCLGRLFARLGRGLDNSERGRALKTLIAMVVERGGFSNDEVKTLLVNAGLTSREVSTALVSCYICNSTLDNLLRELAGKAIEVLRSIEAEVTRFLVSIRSGSQIEKRESEVVGLLGLDTWESVRREVKRYIGKAVAKSLGLTPDFRNPDVYVVVDLDSGSVSAKLSPLIVAGRYVKVGRYISQMPWIRRDGTRKYKLSLYDICYKLLDVSKGSRLVVHAAGREDADARMLGSGRPIALEVKEPKARNTTLSTIRELAEPPWVYVRLERATSRSFVRLVKSSSSAKIYRVVAVSREGLSNEDVAKLESFFQDVVVAQRTPTRVLRRRRDVIRRRRVYKVRATLHSPHILEVLVKSDGGLYIKELVNGDGGRTSPNFSEVVGKQLEPVFLDVLKVELEL
ncbi:MAG: tRNA pseudouridine(54/55) synthase Pus10 [Desulfurococcaceae archaeon]|nr:tRNA pseudouridine(54/55) synthase Pus10 [Desulfurococcaceae archaeon]